MWFLPLWTGCVNWERTLWRCRQPSGEGGLERKWHWHRESERGRGETRWQREERMKENAHGFLYLAATAFEGQSHFLPFGTKNKPGCLPIYCLTYIEWFLHYFIQSLLYPSQNNPILIPKLKCLASAFNCSFWVVISYFGWLLEHVKGLNFITKWLRLLALGFRQIWG